MSGPLISRIEPTGDKRRVPKCCNLDRMRGELSEYSGGLKGVIRLHASTSALVEFLPPELQSFLARYPMIRLQIEERTGAAIVRAVADGSADIGILGNHTPLRGLAAIPAPRFEPRTSHDHGQH